MINRGLVIDTETGGLDDRLHPLVSISLLVFDRATSATLDQFHAKVMPPEGTLLQIPEDPEDTSFNPKVAHLIDINGASYSVNDKTLELRPIITAGAARVNGFTWDGWRGTAIPLEQADASFATFVDTWFDRMPTAYAHNAAFDEKFVRRTFPKTHAAIRQPWLCTMIMYQKYLKKCGEKASAKLVELAKRVNADSSTPAFGSLKTASEDVISKAHDAAADTKMCWAALRWLAAKLGEESVFPSDAPDERNDD